MEVDIPLPSGKPMDTWVAEPLETPAPGVIVIHEAFGMNDDIRRHCENFAQAGYIAAAPNLYATGIRPFCIRKAFKDLQNREGDTFDYLEIARQYLLDHELCTGRVGVIGFCMGGGFALALSPTGKYDAASVNYGEVPGDIDALLSQGACPIVASYGEGGMGWPDMARRLEHVLERNDIPHDVEIYPDAGHSFLNQHGAIMGFFENLGDMGWNEQAANDAWRRIVNFFDEHVRGEA